MSFDLNAKCPKLPDYIKKDYHYKMASMGFKGCKGLAPYFLGCTANGKMLF